MEGRKHYIVSCSSGGASLWRCRFWQLSGLRCAGFLSVILTLLLPMAFAPESSFADYRSEVVSDNPVAYWRLGEASGASAADETVNGHVATYIGGPVLGVAGLLNDDPDTASLFNGSSNYVAVSNHADMNTSGPYSAKTIEMWFKTGSDIGTRQVLYEQGGGTRGLNIYLDNGSVYVSGWNVANDDGGATTPWGPVSVSKAVSANSRYYITLVMEHSTDRIEGFLNGTSIGSASGVGKLYAHSGDINIARSGNTLFYDGPVGSGEYFAGTVDEVALYNSALSGGRILAHYEAGLSKPTISSGYTDIEAKVGSPILEQMPSVTGGESPYAFSISPSLPTGLFFDPSTGRLHGTPTAELATKTTYTVSVSDKNGMTDTSAFDLSVSVAESSSQPETTPGSSGQASVDPPKPAEVAESSPVVSHFALLNRRKSGKKSKKGVTKRKRIRSKNRYKRLTSRSYIRFYLSRKSNVRIVIWRVDTGRKYHGICVPRTLLAKSARKLRICRRNVKMRVIHRRGSEGANRIKFTGYLGPYRMKPGKYKATMVAIGSAGIKSKQESVRFII